MSRNPPPPRRMVHSVMSEMRDKIDLKLKGMYQLEITGLCNFIALSMPKVYKGILVSIKGIRY